MKNKWIGIALGSKQSNFMFSVIDVKKIWKGKLHLIMLVVYLVGLGILIASSEAHSPEAYLTDRVSLKFVCTCTSRRLRDALTIFGTDNYPIDLALSSPDATPPI